MSLDGPLLLAGPRVRGRAPSWLADMVRPGGPIRDVRLGVLGSSGAAAPPTSTTADISTHPIEAPAAASSMADEQLMPGGLALSPAAPAADGARAGAAADGSAAGWRRSARFGAREVL